MLVRGPEQRRGVAVLGPNPIVHHAAQYDGGGGTVTVSLIAEAVDPDEQWQTRQCAVGTVYLFEDAGREVTFYSNRDEDFTLIVTNGDYDACTLVSVFVREYLFFRNVSWGDGAADFPAVLPLQ